MVAQGAAGELCRAQAAACQRAHSASAAHTSFAAGELLSRTCRAVLISAAAWTSSYLGSGHHGDHGWDKAAVVDPAWRPSMAGVLSA